MFAVGGTMLGETLVSLLGEPIGLRLTPLRGAEALLALCGPPRRALREEARQSLRRPLLRRRPFAESGLLPLNGGPARGSTAQDLGGVTARAFDHMADDFFVSRAHKSPVIVTDRPNRSI